MVSCLKSIYGIDFKGSFFLVLNLEIGLCAFIILCLSKTCSFYKKNSDKILY